MKSLMIVIQYASINRFADFVYILNQYIYCFIIDKSLKTT